MCVDIFLGDQGIYIDLYSHQKSIQYYFSTYKQEHVLLFHYFQVFLFILFPGILIRRTMILFFDRPTLKGIIFTTCIMNNLLDKLSF